MTIRVGGRCNVCDEVVILFSKDDNQDITIEILCQKCGTKHIVPFEDLTHDVPHFCCDYELLPAEFSEERSDYIISIVCHECRADNIAVTGDAYYILHYG